MEALIGRLRRFFLPERGVLQRLPYAAIAALGLAVALVAGSLSLVQRLEWGLYDRMMSAATRNPQPPPGIVIVAIDEPSFSELQVPWPWPRRLHAALIDALVRDGARTIVFDLVFDQASTAGDDEALVNAVQRAGNVVLATDHAVTTDRGYQIEQRVLPIPDLAAAAAGVGVVSVAGDPDGVIRRMAASLDGEPTLGLAAAARERGFVQPGEPERPRLIHFLGAPRRGIVTVSYYQVIEPGLLPAGMMRGKIVLIGRSLSAAAALDEPDHFRTPVAALMPGVEIHASQIDTLLRHTAIADPFAGALGALAWAAAFGAIAALLFFRLAPQRGLIALLAVAAMSVAAAYVVLAYHALRVPVVAPLLAATGVFASTSAYRFALGQSERRLIKRAFQHYVSPAIVQQMLDDPSRLRLGGEATDVSIIFTDLEGFTSIAEKMTPAELRSRLSTYFKAMMDVLLAERATLDKFIGDAIMVYFGCPLPDAAHASRACRGALAMQRRLEELNAEWKREGAVPLRMRIGINTGTAIAGNMGTDEIFNYTILGDSVNLASRLEGVNKEYGTLTIAGEDTWARVHQEFEGRELDWIRVKGKAQPVAIHELLAEKGGLSDEQRTLLARYANGLALYRAQRWREAAEAFTAALAISPGDPPSRLFADRCARYVIAPPPQPWNGVYVMTTK